MQAFLFTDIEASTRLWEADAQRMQPALARHDAILISSVRATGGEVVKTTGDGLIAVFPEVVEALRAGIEAQLALGVETWPTSEPLRVRMGIHSGDAERRDDDYFGPTLNRAARLMAAGHGGQVLVSGAAAELATDELPEGSTLRDLGIHRLKDLTEPEHIYQLIHAGLPTEFPPPRTLESRPHNLPIQTTEFFGRTAQLESIIAMISDPAVRLVTLLGPGGSGKTRLGLQVAAEMADRYRDGVFFVDLSRERQAQAAFEEMVRALDVPVTAEGEPLRSLAARLQDREMLVVLDNFEQVTEAAAGVVELLQHCPGLEVLVTSREALRVRPEHVFQVPPMSLPDPSAPLAEIESAESVRLFTERARAIRPDFALNDANARVIAEICHRLDGLPLALELAAARLNVFSPADLARRLSERMDVLGAGGRDLPERQRTLWGTIAWSYELLAEDECRVFEMMAVFSTASLRAVEEVSLSTLGAIDTLDALASLVDKSLIRATDRDGARRFSMLQTVREYALDRLSQDPDLEARVRLAHATFYSHFTKDLRHLLSGPERTSALADLGIELGNLRTAWRLWVDQGDLEQLYLLLDGLWALNDAKGWYGATMDLARDMLDVLATSQPSPERTADELTLRVSLARALMAVKGYSPEVEQAFHDALELAEAGDEAIHRFPVMRALWSYYTGIAQFEKASALAAEVLEMAERDGDRALIAEGHLMYGASRMDETEIALEHLDRAIEMFDPDRQGASRFRLGPSFGVVGRTAGALIRYQAGELTRSLALADEAMEVARRLDHPYTLAYALYHVGFVQFIAQRFERSLQYARELAEVAGAHDYQVWVALAEVLEGVSLSALGEVEVGLVKTETGIEIYQGLTAPPVFWPMVLSLRASAHAAAGNLEAAVALVEEAIETSGGSELSFPEFRIQLGDLIAAAGAPPGAVEESYRSAVRGASAVGSRHIELQARSRLTALLRAEGRDDESDLLRAVYETIRAAPDTQTLVDARRLLEI